MFSNEIFGNVRMTKMDGKPYAVAIDLARVLEYPKPTEAVRINCKGDPIYTGVIDSLGRSQQTRVISQGDILRLIVKAADQSRNLDVQKKAKDVEHWIFDEVIPAVLNDGHYETPEYKLLQSMNTKLELQDQKIVELASVISDSIWSEPVTNPRYDFELYNGWYKDTTKDASHRGLFEAVGDYFGTHVPYSGEVKPITLTQWLIDKVTLDEIKRFVIGIKKGYIVKNELSHYVNLNGFGSNNVEFKKVVDYFGGCCAYCGNNDSTLIPEHIIGQNKMSSIDPTKVDLINNIVCSDGSCNGSKGTEDMETWFRKQPFFTEAKLKKIQRHQIKYSL